MTAQDYALEDVSIVSSILRKSPWMQEQCYTRIYLAITINDKLNIPLHTMDFKDDIAYVPASLDL